MNKNPITGIHACEIKNVKDFVPSYSSKERTRTFLKIQDGCDYFCSFCTIPHARGRSRSSSISNTVQLAREAAANGAKEVVLTGVNIGDFGAGTKENFYDLVKELDQLENIERFRISSIEPNLLSNEIIEFVANSQRFAPHFHIPFQSGSEKILKLMRRRYDVALYKSRIEYIKNVIPDCCIGVDVMAGFPGETESDFLKTYNLLNELDVSYLHVFTYSERPETTALRISEVVPSEERKRRNKMLTILSEKKKRNFYQSQSGKEVKVLFENENHDENMSGFTGNYIKVSTPFNNNFTNQMVQLKLGDLNNQPELHFRSTTLNPVKREVVKESG